MMAARDQSSKKVLRGYSKRVRGNFGVSIHEAECLRGLGIAIFNFPRFVVFRFHAERAL